MADERINLVAGPRVFVGAVDGVPVAVESVVPGEGGALDWNAAVERARVARAGLVGLSAGGVATSRVETLSAGDSTKMRDELIALVSAGLDADYPGRAEAADLTADEILNNTAIENDDRRRRFAPILARRLNEVHREYRGVLTDDGIYHQTLSRARLSFDQVIRQMEQENAEGIRQTAASLGVSVDKVAPALTVTAVARSADAILFIRDNIIPKRPEGEYVILEVGGGVVSFPEGDEDILGRSHFSFEPKELAGLVPRGAPARVLLRDISSKTIEANTGTDNQFLWWFTDATGLIEVPAHYENYLDTIGQPGPMLDGMKVHRVHPDIVARIQPKRSDAAISSYGDEKVNLVFMSMVEDYLVTNKNGRLFQMANLVKLARQVKVGGHMVLMRLEGERYPMPVDEMKAFGFKLMKKLEVMERRKKYFYVFEKITDSEFLNKHFTVIDEQQRRARAQAASERTKTSAPSSPPPVAIEPPQPAPTVVSLRDELIALVESALDADYPGRAEAAALMADEIMLNPAITDDDRRRRTAPLIAARLNAVHREYLQALTPAGIYEPTLTRARLSFDQVLKQTEDEQPQIQRNAGSALDALGLHPVSSIANTGAARNAAAILYIKNNIIPKRPDGEYVILEVGAGVIPLIPITAQLPSRLPPRRYQSFEPKELAGLVPKGQKAKVLVRDLGKPQIEANTGDLGHLFIWSQAVRGVTEVPPEYVSYMESFTTYAPRVHPTVEVLYIDPEIASRIQAKRTDVAVASYGDEKVDLAFMGTVEHYLRTNANGRQFQLINLVKVARQVKVGGHVVLTRLEEPHDTIPQGLDEMRAMGFRLLKKIKHAEPLKWMYVFEKITDSEFLNKHFTVIDEQQRRARVQAAEERATVKAPVPAPTPEFSDGGRLYRSVMRYLPEALADERFTKYVRETLDMGAPEADVYSEPMSLQMAMVHSYANAFTDPAFIAKLNPMSQERLRLNLPAAGLAQARHTTLAAMTPYFLQFPPEEVRRLLSSPATMAMAVDWMLMSPQGIETLTAERHRPHDETVALLEARNADTSGLLASLTNVPVHKISYTGRPGGNVPFYQEMVAKGVLPRGNQPGFRALRVGPGVMTRPRSMDGQIDRDYFFATDSILLSDHLPEGTRLDVADIYGPAIDSFDPHNLQMMLFPDIFSTGEGGRQYLDNLTRGREVRNYDAASPLFPGERASKVAVVNLGDEYKDSIFPRRMDVATESYGQTRYHFIEVNHMEHLLSRLEGHYNFINIHLAKLFHQLEVGGHIEFQRRTDNPFAGPLSDGVMAAYDLELVGTYSTVEPTIKRYVYRMRSRTEFNRIMGENIERAQAAARARSGGGQVGSSGSGTQASGSPTGVPGINLAGVRDRSSSSDRHASSLPRRISRTPNYRRGISAGTSSMRNVVRRGVV